MDPGTALAVVSVGLKVCKGLLDYYNSWANGSKALKYGVLLSPTIRAGGGMLAFQKKRLTLLLSFDTVTSVSNITIEG